MGSYGSIQFIEVCIGSQMVATFARTRLTVERNRNFTNCDVLPLRCSELSATKTVRKEVSVQCVK